jgi:hypothetical protein
MAFFWEQGRLVRFSWGPEARARREKGFRTHGRAAPGAAQQIVDKPGKPCYGCFNVERNTRLGCAAVSCSCG